MDTIKTQPMPFIILWILLTLLVPGSPVRDSQILEINQSGYDYRQSPVNSLTNSLAAYPVDPISDIVWSAGYNGIADIQTAFNNARATENIQLGKSIPMLGLPSQATWNLMSDGEKALWLINRERIDRGVMPLEGLDVNVSTVAQYYADYLLGNNTWGHNADGYSPWERLENNPAIGACHDFLSISENIAVFVTSGSSISLPIERAIFDWMYEDGSCCGWGHRHTILWNSYNDNSGGVGKEGFLGIGRANGGPYQGPFSSSWNYAEMIVMNVFDPCNTWSGAAPIVKSITLADPSPTNVTSINFILTFSESVIGVDTVAPYNDFSITTAGGIGGASITAVSGSSDIYTVTVNTGSGSGTIRLNLIDNDSIKDASNNPLGGTGTGNGNFTAGETYTINKDTTFLDVPTTHMFWRHIEAFYNAGITSGCSQSPRLYCPDNPVTRGEMAVFIERALGNFAPTPSPSGMFTDVPYPGLVSFTPFIEQYYNDGLTVGCSQSPLKYCPQNNVTRGEMAVFIERALGNFAPTPSPTGMFADVPYPGMGSFTPFIEQFYNDGITVGCSQSPLMYCPQNNITRGEMAVFIVRAFGIPLP